jgi:hypothetical protein
MRGKAAAAASARGRLWRRSSMEGWLPCKIHIKMRGGRRRAYVVLQDASGALAPRWHVVLLVRHPSGIVLQVSGKVSRRLGRGYAEVYIPVDAGLSLAAQVGVKAEKSTTIYGYAAKVKEVSPPPPRPRRGSHC